MTPPRPAADAVLRAMLAGGFSTTHGADGRVRILDKSSMMVLDVPKVIRTAWAHESPAFALEALVARDLWPWPTDGVYAARWWSVTPCPLCAAVPSLGDRCTICEGSGWSPATFEATPPSEHDIVSVASLGVAALMRASVLVDVLVPGSRMVWRVRPRLDIEAAHRHMTRAERASPLTLPSIFSAEWCLEWPEHCFWNQDHTRAAWPVMRELGLMGLHLERCEDGYVTLCVEDFP